MSTPTPSWNLVRVYGTWRNLTDGSLKAGTYKVTIPTRVTNSVDDDIIPAGVFASGNLQTVVGSNPSLDIMVPATDDPDTEQAGWTVQIVVSFTDGSITESYSIDVPYANRPTADGGNNQGVDLRTVAISANLPQTQATYRVGVPGGLAKLNSAGEVVDADGNTVTGSGGNTAADTHAATSKTTPADADEIPMTDSAATFNLKKLTWANLKAALSTYFDSIGVAKLKTARTINGVSFNGTANITTRLDQAGVPTNPVSMGSENITNVADPVNDQDAATKVYVDTSIDNAVVGKADLVGGKIPVTQVAVSVAMAVHYTGTVWPARPTTRTDITVFYCCKTNTDPVPSDYIAGVDYMIKLP